MTKRKQYTDEFRASERMATIYGLRVRGRQHLFYVGVTAVDVDRRLAQHLHEAAAGSHSNLHFANTIKKHGRDNIELEVIKTVPYRDRWVAEKKEIQSRIDAGEPLVNKVHVSHGREITEDFNVSITDEQIDWFARHRGSRCYASDPRDQWLVDRMGELIELIAQDLLRRFPTELKREYPRLYELVSA